MKLPYNSSVTFLLKAESMHIFHLLKVKQTIAVCLNCLFVETNSSCLWIPFPSLPAATSGMLGAGKDNGSLGWIRLADGSQYGHVLCAL